jgi:hypothetical protein
MKLFGYAVKNLESLLEKKKGCSIGSAFFYNKTKPQE